ncbi:hypothetical protein [Streptomyces sp. MB09-02B]|uniref:hypothetical protein n=1 Tax=Streptomyces sp. MB09-02B TaxID=3028667 RepID=UPI0029A49A29|nr:hypothetical protein [Streptomyces sp. MB09-02B]MDX3639110.1 hypothetical protein [Streptomyces sp. MB09-02B]
MEILDRLRADHGNLLAALEHPEEGAEGQPGADSGHRPEPDAAGRGMNVPALMYPNGFGIRPVLQKMDRELAGHAWPPRSTRGSRPWAAGRDGRRPSRAGCPLADELRMSRNVPEPGATRRGIAANVACAAGVSRATAGFVLNDTAGQDHPTTTRDRVLEAATPCRTVCTATEQDFLAVRAHGPSTPTAAEDNGVGRRMRGLLLSHCAQT